MPLPRTNWVSPWLDHKSRNEERMVRSRRPNKTHPPTRRICLMTNPPKADVGSFRTIYSRGGVSEFFLTQAYITLQRFYSY